MSRSGYTDDYSDDDPLVAGRWRGQVASAIRGKRGQAFLRELVEALDSMPFPRLIKDDLRRNGEVCAIGRVGALRGVQLETIDHEDYDAVADAFGIAHQLVQEIEFMNDDEYLATTPEERWKKVRDWAADQIRATPAGPKS